MAIKGNKGEWGEIYTLLKLLGDGKVHAGDQNMNKIKDLFYPIIMILREEDNNHLNYIREEQDVVIQTPEREELLRIPSSIFLEEAEELLKSITENNGAFSVPRIETFMQKIHCNTLKTKSTNKSDIRIIFHDLRTKINSEMGFSIKTQLGHPSTLLNASKATNFSYKIEGAFFSEEEIEAINTLNPSKNKVIERVKAIINKGGKLVFHRVDNPIFYNNLTLIDSNLPNIIALLLLEQIDSNTSDLKTLIEKINQKNPMNYPTENGSPFYSYKIKHLLTSVALGMQPASTWDGTLEANGGYLVVKKDGEILCYHFYDRNLFENYLLTNSYLERSSTTRHEYATIIKEEDNSLIFKLNLQIRLK